MHSISAWLDQSACRFPAHVAIEDSTGATLSYRELASLARAIAASLVTDLGVGRGDRVGIFMRKSIDAVIAFHAVLRSGAAYVPLDPSGPASRAALMLQDCEARVVFVDEDMAESLQNELRKRGLRLTLLLVPRESQHG